jgi:hypothetical protein
MATNPPDVPTLTMDEKSRTLTSVLVRFAPGLNNGGSDVVGYELLRDEGIQGSPFKVIYDGTSKPEIIVYNDTNLQTSLTYTYKLFSINRIFRS